MIFICRISFSQCSNRFNLFFIKQRMQAIYFQPPCVFFFFIALLLRGLYTQLPDIFLLNESNLLCASISFLFLYNCLVGKRKHMSTIWDALMFGDISLNLLGVISRHFQVWTWSRQPIQRKALYENQSLYLYAHSQWSLYRVHPAWL